MFQKLWDWFASLFAPVASAPAPEPTDPPPTKPAPPSAPPTDPKDVPGYRGTVLARWRAAKIRAERAGVLEQQAAKILAYRKEYYDPVEKALGIPWYVIGVIDMRESDFSHAAYLGNGQSLNRVTTIVPKGRGPFLSWYAGAIDALRLQGFHNIKHWDIVTALIQLEIYNGLGYKGKGLPSPYVWAGTNIQVKGKYVSDGHFDPGATDNQPGCAGVLLALRDNHGINLRED